MPARTKGRAKFDFHGRPFVWWIDGDRYLRINSLDKKFVVAVGLISDDEFSLVEVIGQEFPGIDPHESRPVRLKGPRTDGGSIGAWVEAVMEWAFDPDRPLIRAAVHRRRCSRPFLFAPLALCVGLCSIMGVALGATCLDAEAMLRWWY